MALLIYGSNLNKVVVLAAITECSLSTIHPKRCRSASANIWPHYSNSSFWWVVEASPLSGQSGILLPRVWCNLSEIFSNFVLLFSSLRKEAEIQNPRPISQATFLQCLNNFSTCCAFERRQLAHFTAQSIDHIQYAQAQPVSVCRAPLSHVTFPHCVEEYAHMLLCVSEGGGGSNPKQELCTYMTYCTLCLEGC